MITVLHQEYLNKNANRKYPFTDLSTLIDKDQNSLPYDFILDACIYPNNTTGEIYLSKLDLVSNKGYISSLNNSEDIGYFDINKSLDYSYIFEIGNYFRKIGIIIFGNGVKDIFNGSGMRIFFPLATQFVSSCVFPINQTGVNGFILPDGSLVTGDVKFVGKDGIEITTFIDNGEKVLRVDAVGAPPSDLADCYDIGEPISTIIIERTPNSIFSISKYDDNTLALTIPKLNLPELCELSRSRKRIETNKYPKKDPCSPDIEEPENPAEPENPEEDEDVETLIFDLKNTSNKFFNIVAPSTVDYINPIRINSKDNGLTSAKLSISDVLLLSQNIENDAKKFTSPNSVGGEVEIVVDGLMFGNRA